VTDVHNPLAGTLDFLQSLDDNTRDSKFNQLSRDLVNNLFILMRSAAMHDLGNDAMNRPRSMLADTVNTFVDRYHEEASLQLVDGNFFVNKRLIRLDLGTFENSRYLTRIFEYLGINELTFFRRIEPTQLNDLLVAFLRVVRNREGKITDYPVECVRMRRLEMAAAQERGGEGDPRSNILTVYASGLLTLRAFVNDLRRGKTPRHSRIKRLCLDLIDVEPRHHNLLLALLHLEAYKGNLFAHLLNAAVLSIVFGSRLGLTRNQLVDLGMAAFHHDLGWALMGVLDVPPGTEIPELTMEGIAAQEPGTPEETDALRVKVARALVRLGGFNESVINRLIVAWECQLPEDAAARGLYYGEVGAGFMTHVVRMASAYDDLTTSRPNRPALPHDQAMRRILDDGGRTFDVFLAKLFANCIGAYPVGTLVELDTSEIGLVVNLPSNPVNFHRPQVKILVDKLGQGVPDGEIVDLNDTYRGGRRYVRTIERTVPAARYGLTVTRFFFG
jgi:HD-GYP domain-containing protein (c-di-GMP phosphodiesterase class II)